VAANCSAVAVAADLLDPLMATDAAWCASGAVVYDIGFLFTTQVTGMSEQ
jgi:hypothetical protein